MRFATIIANTRYGYWGADTSAASRRQANPASRYDAPELVEALRTIRMASDQLCGKRHKAALPLWLPHCGASFYPLSADTLAMLDTISAATIDRLRKPIRARIGRRG